jgi:hypothetical protein
MHDFSPFVFMFPACFSMLINLSEDKEEEVKKIGSEFTKSTFLVHRLRIQKSCFFMLNLSNTSS